MATERKTVPITWHADGRITAAGDTDVLMANTSDKTVYFAITDDDTAPLFHIAYGHPIRPGEPWSLTLADGKRLWRATRAEGVVITETVEAA
ncbi:hypothetical protein [Salipiger sp.]|uniref:hypothetical protein n=1 Tax=Salipiger sp. TaxID=2078585 RepID=UPI003A9850DB